MALPGKSDIKVTASDALEFEPVMAEPAKSRWGFKLFAILILAGGGAGAWTFFGDDLIQRFSGGDGGVPLVRAPAGPVKVRPENPGGLKVPDRDKLVYDRMQKTAAGDGGKDGDQDGGEDRGRGPERLLPPPEQPLPKPAAKRPAVKKPAEKPVEKAAAPKQIPTPKTKPVAKVPTVKDVKTAKRPAPPPPPPAPPSSGQAFKAAPAQTAEKTEAAPKPQPVAKVAKPAPVEAVPAAPSPSPAPAQISRSDSYLIQLAAARSSEGARTEWERLKTKHRDLLGNLGLVVTKADLGPGKGIFYRLRAGPLANENAARALCQQLAQRQVGCLIIKPLG